MIDCPVMATWTAEPESWEEAHGLLVGLADASGHEIKAEWYQRRAYAAEVSWPVTTSEPWSGGSWIVAYWLVIDGATARSIPLSRPVTLQGPQQRMEPLTARQKAYRQAHGMPMTDDPYLGDTLTLQLPTSTLT